MPISWSVDQTTPSPKPLIDNSDSDAVLDLSGDSTFASDVLNDDGTLAPSFLDKKQDLKSRITGSVFINGQSSYSGADIKVVVHVYDGGKAAEDKRKQLEQDLKDAQDDLVATQDTAKKLAGSLNDVDAVFSSADVDRLNGLNRKALVLENSILAMRDEIERLGSLKPQFSTKVLAELQTISVSTHREKFPVRALGTVYPKSFTRGPRTIAGTMIFTVFDKNVLSEFLDSHPSDFDAHNPVTSCLLDQVPPFDITIAFANELGQVSRMSIYGVEFVNEGQTMSIEDLLLENVVQYVARDIDPMRIVGVREIDENMRLSKELRPLSASALLTEDDYDDFKRRLSPYERFKHRRNPFI